MCWNCKYRAALWSVWEEAQIIFQWHFHQRIPIWSIKCLKILICLIFLVRICCDVRWRLSGS